MTKLKLDLPGPPFNKAYFRSVDQRLAAMGVSRLALSRQLDMDGPQFNRYFTIDHPNPTLDTIIAIEEAIVTVRRRKAQEK